MADPQWFGPPEAVAALLETSDPSTIVAAIAAWLAEAVQHELSMGVSVANIAATLEQWVGLGGASYGMKGSELNFLGLQPLAAHCLKHVAIGHAAVEANTLARSAVIPAVVCLENRAEFAALNSSNICGSNTPAIIANEATYHGYYTPYNGGVGATYYTAMNGLTGAIASTPTPITPAGFSPAEAAGPADSVADSAANTAGGLPSAPAELAQAAAPAGSSPVNAMSQIMQPMQSMLSSATQPVQQLASVPTQGFQSGASLLQNFMGGMFPGSQSSAAAAEAAAAGAVGGPLGAAGGAGGLGAGVGGGGAGALGAGYSGAGLTSFTRPASTFSPEIGGRATGLNPAGLLNAAELRGPTTTAPTGGAGMPMSPASAGMLGRENAGADKNKVPHARIVVDGDKQEPQPC